MSDYFLKIMHYLIVSAQSYFMLSKIPNVPLYIMEMWLFFTEFLMKELLIFTDFY